MTTRLMRKQAALSMIASAGEDIHRTIGKLKQLLEAEDDAWIDEGIEADFNVRPIFEAVLRLQFYVADFDKNKATVEALTEAGDATLPS